MLGSDEFALFGRVFQSKGDFVRREYLAGAGFEVAAPEGADADADEFLDPQAHAGEHLADLAFEALFEDDAGAACREAADVFGLGLAFGDAESLEELDEDGVVEVLVECDPVFFFDAVGGVGERLGQYAVVGHDDETFGVRVEATDVVDVVVADGQEVVDRAVCSLRFATAYDAARFVEQDGDFFLGGGVASVNLDEVRREDADAGSVDGFSVDFDASFGDEFVCCPARFIPARCEEFVEANASFRRFRIGCVFFCHIYVFIIVSNPLGLPWPLTGLGQASLDALKWKKNLPESLQPGGSSKIEGESRFPEIRSSRMDS